MTAAQAAADRRVINAAKQIERAATYGVNAGPAVTAYDNARAEQAKARGERAA
jgi:hypothetical protein